MVCHYQCRASSRAQGGFCVANCSKVGNRWDPALVHPFLIHRICASVLPSPLYDRILPAGQLHTLLVKW